MNRPRLSTCPAALAAAIAFAALLLLLGPAGSVSADVITVTTAADANPPVTNDFICSLREAIDRANNPLTANDCTPVAQAGTDEIRFAIVPQDATVKTIVVASGGLPSITAPVLIDGWTQRGVPGYTGPPLIELNGAAAGALSDGLSIVGAAAGGSTVRGLVINRFRSGISISGAANVTVVGSYIGTNAAGTADLGNVFDGVVATDAASLTIGGTTAGARNVISGNDGFGVLIVGAGATGAVVQGNYIGTDATGTADLGNTFSGVAVSDAPNATIGGTAAGARNVISGNNTGVGIDGAGATGAVVQGNFIGTNAAGTAALGNTVGVFINAPNVTIGGTAPGAGNVISGNVGDGVTVNVAQGTGAAMQGNYIGTDATGTADLGNGGDGVSVAAPNATIGGTAAGVRNVISGNGGNGVLIEGAEATGAVVQGNCIGTNAAGTADLGNGINGVFVDGAPGAVIGGAAAGARNVISGNSNNGILISGAAATGAVVQGNYIGTDVAGTADLGNGGNGVGVDGAPGAVIGGAGAGEGNVISGNGNSGVAIGGTGASGAVVRGNFIGTNAAGSAAVGNGNHGVFVVGAPNATVGGTAPGARNVISSNNEGVLVFGAGATGALIQGNFIGTDAAGTADLGNGNNGVRIVQAPNATIGGTIAGAGNVISGNGGAGVAVESAAQNAILGNRIFANDDLGIDLGNDGVTPNDAPAACDADAGANNLQNFPVLTTAVAAGGSTTIGGTLTSTPGTTFRVELFASLAPDPSGFGEGEQFLGFVDVTTSADAACTGAFTRSIPLNLAGQVITATATDPANNTSEFSQALAVTASADLGIQKVDAPDPVAPGAELAYTITAQNPGPATVANAQLADQVPTNTTFVSVTPPAGWTCPTAPAVGGTGSVTCTTPSFAPGSAVFTLRVRVGAAVAPGTILSNTATVSGTPNADATNDSATATTTVGTAPVAGPDLALAKSHAGSFAVGANGAYTLTVSNVGTGPTTAAITVTDTLPTGLGFVSGTGTGWTCGAVGQQVTCTNPGPLAASASSQITLTVSVAAAAVPQVTNTASVAGGGDANPANNAASDPTTVATPPAGVDLQLSKGHVGGFTVGTNGTYTLIVSNVGTGPTTAAITVTDTLPTGLTFVSGTGTGWTCGAVGQQVTCTSPGPLAFGQSSQIVLTVGVAAAAVPQVTNTASVATAGDANAANNAASDPTAVQPSVGPPAPSPGPAPVAELPGLPPSPGDDSDDDAREERERETEEERRQRARTNQGNKDDDSVEGDVIETRCDQPWPAVVIVNRDGAVEVKLVKEAQKACTSIQVGDYLEADGEKQHEYLFHADSVEVKRRR